MHMALNHLILALLFLAILFQILILLSSNDEIEE
jgi:uncharacterized membrane protein